MWRDRAEAGQELAGALMKYKDRNAVVYGLPRGGVVVAAEVAHALNAPLDLIIARKIGHPAHAEYAIAAVTEDSEPVVNEAEVASIGKDWFERALKEQRVEAKRRRELYLGGRRHISPKGKIAIVVDDGIATGLTLQAAIKSLKPRRPAKIVVAVPVAPDDTVAEIEAEVDEMVCLHKEKDFFGAVGSYYQFFEQVEDSEVIDLLQEFDTYDPFDKTQARPEQRRTDDELSINPEHSRRIENEH
ncbi:phosphoribosyl transferase [Candidatus Saccharibacteria bacterium]|nr:phosphoribosyl transferase [Candidatus Saccharibacteria bacterium]